MLSATCSLLFRDPLFCFLFRYIWFKLVNYVQTRTCLLRVDTKAQRSADCIVFPLIRIWDVLPKPHMITKTNWAVITYCIIAMKHWRIIQQHYNNNHSDHHKKNTAEATATVTSDYQLIHDSRVHPYFIRRCIWVILLNVCLVQTASLKSKICRDADTTLIMNV